MRISIAYPPIPRGKGAPLISQNRQFQYFNAPTYIYPVVPAYAATLLKSKGYGVQWNDGIAANQTFAEFVTEIEAFGPDMMAVESKTPTIKAMWHAITALKDKFPKMTIVLMGDHVTAMPEESLENSSVDYVITGGDFDFQLLALARHLDVGDPMAPGVYYREDGQIKNTGKFVARGNLEELPMIDRELTKWRLYAYRNGNFKYLPGTYTMVGRDCFPAGTLIETSEGQIPVEHVHTHHWARTHLGNYGRVVSHWAREATASVILKTYCNPAVQVTPEHPFFTQRGWVPAKELQADDYVAFPRHRETNDANELYGLPMAAEDLWFYGLYVAEGYLAKSGRSQMTLTINRDEIKLKEELLKYCEWRRYTVRARDTGTALQLNIGGGKSLAEGLKALFGLSAHHKGIHPAVMLLPQEKLLAFLGGYLAGDGHMTKRGDSLRSVTVSKRLSFDLRNIFLRCGVIASVTKDGLYANELTGRTIRGKWHPYRLSITRQFRAIWQSVLQLSFSTIHAHASISSPVVALVTVQGNGVSTVIPADQRSLFAHAPQFSAMRREGESRGSTGIPDLPQELHYEGKVVAYLSDTHAFYRVRYNKPAGPVTVYNFSVDGDHSYLADGLAVHNCWWRRPAGKDKLGGCTFCSWTSIWPTWRTQSAGKLLDEIGQLIKLGVREVFDDTGTLPVGPWLQEFCEGMIKRGYNKKMVFGCNMRAGALTREQYQLMGKAGFRFILYGLESASQKTLDRINKGTTPKQMEEAVKWASEAGCHPHVTCMVGYPWESYEEAKATVDFTTSLFRKGYIKTLQATVIIPYPGTELFRQCKANGWLLTEDYDEYDMREPVMKSPITHDQILSLTQGIYRSAMTPEFILREVMSIRNVDDMKYYWRAGRQFFGHIFDFQAEKGKATVAKERVGSAV